MASGCDAANPELARDLTQPSLEAEEGPQPTPLQLRCAEAKKRAKELGVPCLFAIMCAVDTARAAGPAQFEELLCQWIRQGDLDTAIDYLGPTEHLGSASAKDDHAGVGRALLYAVASKKFRVARVLLEELHADAGAKDVFLRTTLMWAAGFGGAAVTRALLDAGADPQAADTIRQSTALHYLAVCSDDADEAHALLEGGACVDAQDSRGWTPLVVAAHNGHTAVMKALLDAGADPLAAGRDGVTARNAPREFTAVHWMLRAAILRRPFRGVRQMLRKLPLVSRGPPAPAAADRRAAQSIAAV